MAAVGISEFRVGAAGARRQASNREARRLEVVSRWGMYSQGGLEVLEKLHTLVSAAARRKNSYCTSEAALLMQL